jgi:hypothetical protein
VIASHVLEHVANPIAALAEWHRVVRPGGIIYFVVPNRLAAFDHARELTSVEHLIDDYITGATAHDATHIDEFAFGVDWPKYRPDAPLDDVPAQREQYARGMHEAVKRGEDINIHFHTFEPSTLRELLETLSRWPDPDWFRRAGKPVPGDAGTALPPVRFNWEVVDFEDGFPDLSPNGVLAVLRVHKGWRARADAEALRIRAGNDIHATLRPGAKPLSRESGE